MFAKKYFLPERTNVISRTKHGFYLKLNLKNPEHQYYFFYMSHDERYEINNLQKIINNTDVCWDIGANIGLYSLYAARAKGLKVFAFEPESTNFARFNNNINLTLDSLFIIIEKDGICLFQFLFPTNWRFRIS